MKFLRLNADRIETIFIVSFIAALFLLIVHMAFKTQVLLDSGDSIHNDQQIQYRNKHAPQRTWSR
ncbi:MAG: hypothetical protein CO156_04650 [Candidatus Pacebacteria bacterium CG_4_9_14_3_um_filter_40_12]|nr:MAG: hypothetical protein CO156_04650 [Candidatus Pacebacteria bacterium CG_4_9_14_3_um_filter_40_12]PJC43293.1 MAG: hypothetical protein CO039_04700 [Candidatus Pacebacteria bacterium CG_4_9_14_0_2_um_filter_34_50]